MRMNKSKKQENIKVIDFALLSWKFQLFQIASAGVEPAAQASKPAPPLKRVLPRAVP